MKVGFAVDDNKTKDVTSTYDTATVHKPDIATKLRHEAPAVSARARDLDCK